MHVRVCVCVCVCACLSVALLCGGRYRGQSIAHGTLFTHCTAHYYFFFYNIDGTLCHISIEQARYIATFDWKCEMYVMNTYYWNSFNKEDKCKALILTSNNE